MSERVSETLESSVHNRMLQGGCVECDAVIREENKGKRNRREKVN